jgi:peptide alpha-N-acetyltransferase
LYFLASHYSSISNHQLALETLAKAEAHTPSLPELPMLRARILKRAGDLQAAADAMEEARELDGQDRGLNCKSVKYLIRAGRIEEAEKIAGLFTKVSLRPPF